MYLPELCVYYQYFPSSRKLRDRWFHHCFSPCLQIFGGGNVTHFESLLDSSLSIFKENIAVTKPETMDFVFNLSIREPFISRFNYSSRIPDLRRLCSNAERRKMLYFRTAKANKNWDYIFTDIYEVIPAETRSFPLKKSQFSVLTRLELLLCFQEKKEKKIVPMSWNRGDKSNKNTSLRITQMFSFT